jgi:hypothetical protein
LFVSNFMETEIDQVIASLRNHLKDSHQKTHKSLIASLSSLTVHLDRGEVEVDLSKQRGKNN